MGSGERGDGPRGMRLTGKDDRAGPRRFFGARRHRFRHRHPSISWKPFALVATALAGLAGLLLDGPATLLARHQPDWLASFSVATTDIGKSGWLIGGSHIQRRIFRADNDARRIAADLEQRVGVALGRQALA